MSAYIRSILVCISVISTDISATPAQIKKGLQVTVTNNATGTDRNLVIPYDAINNYACWCFFGSEWRKGRGKYENEIDHACHDLHDCYKCAAIDADNEDSNCEAATEPYILPSSEVGDAPNKVYSACKKANRGRKCRIRACSCEVWFMKKITGIFTSPNFNFDSSYKHEYGWSLDQCDPTFGVEGRRECCGYYPQRYPYNYEIGKRCCYTNIYDKNSEKCCAGGQVAETCGDF